MFRRENDESVGGGGVYCSVTKIACTFGRGRVYTSVTEVEV